MNDGTLTFLAAINFLFSPVIFRLRFHNLGKGCLPASWKSKKIISGNLYIRRKTLHL
jgi:hypothetical protein